jgi:hypothetical protein
MSAFVIEPGNSYDFLPADLFELERTIKEADPAVTVEVVFPEERGYGTTLHEVLRIWTEVKDSGEAIATTVTGVKLAIEFMRRRWLKDRDEHAGELPRPRDVIIFGPDGMPLESVKIDLPEGDPKVEPPEDDDPRLPRSS